MQDHQAASREIQRFYGIHGEKHVLHTVDVEAPARGPAVLQSVLSFAGDLDRRCVHQIADASQSSTF